MSFCALSGGQIAPSNLQIKTICSLLITINGIWSNYPRAKKRLQKWNRKRKKGRNMNMSIPKQLLSQSYIPPINTSLLLSESYGSAFKSILAFNYEKIALVGSGRRSEDRKSRKKVLYYLSVLWLFHFTNRSPPVYYVMVSRKNQNHRRDVSWGSAPCTVSKFILSKSRSGVGSKKNWKNSGKIQELEVNTTRSTCEMKLIGQKFTKGRNERNQKGKRVWKKWVYYYDLGG